MTEVTEGTLEHKDNTRGLTVQFSLKNYFVDDKILEWKVG